MNAVALTEEERELADELCRRLAQKHAFGKRVTIELVVEDVRVIEVFCHFRIPRGREEPQTAS